MGNGALGFFVIVAVGLAGSMGEAEDVAPLVCPPGAKLEVLEGDRGRIEFCARGEILHGPAREWYPNGMQRTADKWFEGQRIGVWVIWDEQGVKREERCYRAGKLDGRETYWHPNRRRRSITHYRAGVKEGPIAEWDENGLQIAAGQFEGGRAQGTWTFRRPGTPDTFSVLYKDGEKVSAGPIAPTEFREWHDNPVPTCPAF